MGSERHVLVVEDDEGIRLLLDRLMRRAGLHVDCAADGAAAIEMLETRRYDTLILDLMMPGTDGFEVLQYLGSERHADMCVIVCTAAGPVLIGGRSLDRANHVVTKPFDFETIGELAATCTNH